VAFPVDMASVLVLAICVALVDVHPCLCVSSVSGDSVFCHLGMEGNHLSDCPKA